MLGKMAGVIINAVPSMLGKMAPSSMLGKMAPSSMLSKMAPSSMPGNDSIDSYTTYNNRQHGQL